METISNTLFWISNGLLVPVVILLLLLLAKAVLLTSSFFGEFYHKVNTRKEFALHLEELTPGNAEEKMRLLIGSNNTPLQQCLSKLYSHRENTAYCERLLANFEIDAEQELGRSRTFVKLGPMLGLMGTLIPMGPALVGLATGDISSMAYNMQVAFATTVIGMVIAAIGVVTLQIRQRWYAREINDLEFINKTLYNAKQTSTQSE